MTDHKQREAVASRLLQFVNKGDEVKVKVHLNQFKDDSQWRDIIRFEFPVQELMTDILQYDISLPRLLSYEISTLSPFHYAALRGLNDILVHFFDHDIPADMALMSGTTALHLAAFGGKTECIRMLVDIYKAELNKQDKYGWSALHYACTEGQYNAVKLLLNYGIKVSLRDQDGTTAAFRAQVNRYEDIVQLLTADDPSLLEVDYTKDVMQYVPCEDIYSQVGVTLPRNKKNEPPKAPALRKTHSLPPDLKDKGKAIIRRLIRQELESLEGDSSTYVQPATLLNHGPKDPSEDEVLALRSIGPNTLKGVMREEFSKYAKQLFSSTSVEEEPIKEELPADLGVAPQPPRSREYEVIYETVKLMPPPSGTDAKKDKDVETSQTTGQKTGPTSPPPLPPRVISTNSDGQNQTKDLLLLSRSSFLQSSDSAALFESLSRIAELLGSDWKKLAYELPLEKTPIETQLRVEGIEQKYAGDMKRQAAAALEAWRTNKGSQADVDRLIVALRRCGMNSLVDEVDRATQEYTA